MTKPGVYCSIHGAELADDCIECMGDDFEADPGEEVDIPTEEQKRNIFNRVFGNND